MNLKACILIPCLMLTACLTNEQIAEQQHQQAAQRAQQEMQIKEKLTSTCEQYGYQRNSPQMNECMARTVQQLKQIKQQQDERETSVQLCAARLTQSMGYFPALGVCNQNPSAMPPQQVIMAPAPAIPQPTQTRCMPIPGGGMSCQTY